ncbi:MAG: type II secretion system F family protein, partial [Candidatus Delongbacteria bacterium]|nr:type II secretion system F family protein [Candidatus Delongbacteria bacterium]
MLYSIGEFSNITNLTPKMLKIYHEMELLTPAKVDEFSKYRYYNEHNLETARLIVFFKQFDLSLSDIKEIVDNKDDESFLAELLEKQKDIIENKINKYNFVMELINEKLKRGPVMNDQNNTSKHRSRFWKMFSKLIREKVSITDSLKIASKNADGELKAVISEFIDEIIKGNTLHDTMSKYSTVFTELEIIVLEASHEISVINTSLEINYLATASNMLGSHLEEVGFPDNSEGQKNTRSKYWKTFGLLLEAGVSLTKGMEIASEWADEKVQTATEQMIGELCNGQDFFTALKGRPEIFTELEIEMNRVGEVYGILDVTIALLPKVVRMIEETEDEKQKRKDFWKVVGYYDDFVNYIYNSMV